MKRIAAILTFLVFSLNLFSFNTFAAPKSGKTGECTWSLNGTVLTVRGKGKMGVNSPWGNNITKVVLSDGITEIGTGNFTDCDALAEITVPNTVKAIGDYAFSHCDNLTKLTLPDGITRIGTGIVKDTPLAKVGKKPLYINRYLISLNTDYCGKFTPKSGTRAVAAGAFANCAKLTEVTFKSGIKNIGYRTFFRCDKLTRVNIPKSVVSIDKFAFDECNLKKITINGNYGAYSQKYAKENGIKFTDTTHKKCTAKTITVKATAKKDGKTAKVCKICEKTLSESAIRKVSFIKLAKSTYVYDGKIKTPTVTVKNSAGKKLAKNRDYTIIYPKNAKNAGIYCVKVNFKGKYKGTEKLYFKINPKSPTVKSLTKGKTSVTVVWSNTSSAADGYTLRYGTTPDFKNAVSVTVKGNSALKKTVKNLKVGKTYYFSVRAFKKCKNTTLFSAYSAKKSVTVPKAATKNAKTVYITPSGKKYHTNSACGGKNSYSVTLENAVKLNKTPCKKCAK